LDLDFYILVNLDGSYMTFPSTIVVESKDGTISVASAFAGHQEGDIVVSSSTKLSTVLSHFIA